jgi:hypothetical protein
MRLPAFFRAGERWLLSRLAQLLRLLGRLHVHAEEPDGELLRTGFRGREGQIYRLVRAIESK